MFTFRKLFGKNTSAHDAGQFSDKKRVLSKWGQSELEHSKKADTSQHSSGNFNFGHYLNKVKVRYVTLAVILNVESVSKNLRITLTLQFTLSKIRLKQNYMTD